MDLHKVTSQSRVPDSQIELGTEIFSTDTIMKTLKCIICVAAIAVAVACTRIEAVTPSETDGMRTVTITMVEEAGTRATLNATGTGMVWNTGDQVAFFVDDDGLCQIAPIANDGTFSVTLDASTHTIAVVYPVGDYEVGDARDANKEGVPTLQTQVTLDKFTGANLPLVGTATVEAGSGDAANATYHINNAALLQFTIACAETTYDLETLSELVVTSPGNPTYTVTLPSGTTIADARGKKVFAVIPSGDYGNLKAELSTSGATGATYRCGTNIITKTSTTTIDPAVKWNFTLILLATTITRTEGIMISKDGGAWQSWDGASDLGLGDGTTLGVPTPYSIKVATGGTTALSVSNMGQLKTSISGLNDDSRIALDLSAAKIASDALLNHLTSALAELHSFVFPENNTNITDLTYAFAGCRNLVSVSAIPGSVTNMSNTFNGCTAFNQPITIPSRVTNMSSTFSGCTAFNQPITIPSRVENMSLTFSGCYSLGNSSVATITINIASGKTISADGSVGANDVDIMHMFEGCTTSHIALSVTSSYLGNMSENKIWYSNLTNGCWLFSSVTGIW